MAHPIVGWLYVGAGIGSDLEGYLPRDVTHLLAVEASQETFSRLEKKLAGNPEWVCRNVLVAQQAGESIFHHASNPKESALVPAQELRALWRNLESINDELLKSHSLVDIFQEHQLREEWNFNWLTIDCFPAADLLAGAENEFGHLDVIEVRALATPNEIAPSLAGSSLEECRQLLGPAGFVERAKCEEATPGVVRAFFVRDWQSLARGLEKSAQKVQADLRVANELISRQTSELGILRQDNAALSAKLKETSHSEAASEVEIQKLAEQQARIDTLTIEKTQLEARIDSVSTERTQQQQAQSALEKQLSSLTDELLAAQRSAGQAKSESREAKEIFKRLEREMTESDQKMQMLRQELLMAEAQLAFIKDLLLDGHSS